jgi:hypothetical protein
MIDNQISKLNISDGVFICSDSLGIERRKINFIYHVGYIELIQEEYEFFSSLQDKLKITVKFNNRIINPAFKEDTYEYTFTSDWINKEYMLLKIYTATK